MLREKYIRIITQISRIVLFSSVEDTETMFVWISDNAKEPNKSQLKCSFLCHSFLKDFYYYLTMASGTSKISCSTTLIWSVTSNYWSLGKESQMSFSPQRRRGSLKNNYNGFGLGTNCIWFWNFSSFYWTYTVRVGGF